MDVLKADLSGLSRIEFQHLINEATSQRYYRIGLVCRAVMLGTTMSVELWAGDNLLVKKEIENIDKLEDDIQY